jgi:hypothetical protein
LVSPKNDASKLHRFLAPMENTKLLRGLSGRSQSSPASAGKQQSGCQKRAKGKAKSKAKARPCEPLHPSERRLPSLPEVL